VLNILTGGSQPEPSEAACVEDVGSAGAGSSDNIAFTVLSKKGNKQQVTYHVNSVHLPCTHTFLFSLECLTLVAVENLWVTHASLQSLRSSTTSALVAPRTVRATIGDRTFPAAAASVWNSLPESVRASPSLQVFRSRLKTELFALSYSCSD